MANVLTLTTPLMRQTVGFDRFNDLFETLLNETSQSFDNYPPYNIEKLGEYDYRIVMAVAGFALEDLKIVMENGELTISGSTEPKPEEEGVQLLHRGIGSRSFERKFKLADHILVESAEMKDGLLTISLVREIPEEKKPRTIPISETSSKRLLGKNKK